MKHVERLQRVLGSSRELVRDDLHHQADAGHLDHLSALLLDLRYARAGALGELGELEQRLVQLFQGVPTLGRHQSLQAAVRDLRPVLQTIDLCLRVRQVDLLRLVLAFDVLQEPAEQGLDDVLHRVDEHILLGSLSKALAVCLVHQLRVQGAPDHHSADELSLVERVARAAKGLSIEGQPIVLVLAIRKDAESIAEQQDA